MHNMDVYYTENIIYWRNCLPSLNKYVQDEKYPTVNQHLYANICSKLSIHFKKRIIPSNVPENTIATDFRRHPSPRAKKNHPIRNGLGYFSREHYNLLSAEFTRVFPALSNAPAFSVCGCVFVFLPWQKNMRGIRLTYFSIIADLTRARACTPAP